MKRTKTKLVSLLMVLISIVPVYARPLSIRMKATLQHGCPRIPSATGVKAEYNDDVVKVFLQRYYGTVWMYIYDANGNIASSTVAKIDGDGDIDLDIQSLAEGEYTVSITISNATYEGTLRLSK